MSRYRYEAAEHHHLTIQGTPITWHAAHRIDTETGTREVMIEHDGSVTPFPGAAEALEAAAANEGWWWETEEVWTQ